MPLKINFQWLTWTVLSYCRNFLNIKNLVNKWSIEYNETMKEIKLEKTICSRKDMLYIYNITNNGMSPIHLPKTDWHDTVLIGQYNYFVLKSTRWHVSAEASLPCTLNSRGKKNRKTNYSFPLCPRTEANFQSQLIFVNFLHLPKELLLTLFTSLSSNLFLLRVN